MQWINGGSELWRGRILSLALGFAIAILIVVAFLGYQSYQARNTITTGSASEVYHNLVITRIDSTSAPNFSLTDQHGKQISLNDLKGKTVVLSFMDPECTDVCPIVSQEYIQAYKQLGNDRDKVAFVAVNVNQYHKSVGDVREFSRQHGLNELPNWHFVTGQTSDLKRVWKQYGIAVQPAKDGDVQHSDYLFFIGPDGNERWVSPTSSDKGQIDDYSSLITHYAKRTLSGQ